MIKFLNFIILLSIIAFPDMAIANDKYKNPKLAKQLLNEFNNTFFNFIDIKFLDPKEYKLEFKEYYNSNAYPRLSHMADYILEDAHAFIDIDMDGKDELILWSDGLKPSAWGAKDFIAILSQRSGSWKVETIKALTRPQISCEELGSCKFSWARYNPPFGPNSLMGGMLIYADHGATGATFWIETIQFNRYSNNFEIKTSSSSYPLSIDYAWGHQNKNVK